MCISAFFQVFWANIHNFFEVQGNVKVSYQFRGVDMKLNGPQQWNCCTLREAPKHTMSFLDQSGRELSCELFI